VINEKHFAALSELFFPDSWDYDFDKPEREALHFSYLTLEVLDDMSFEPIKVLPSAEGGVGIVLAISDKICADIECFNSGEILAVISGKTRASIDVWEVEKTPEGIRETLEKIKEAIHAMS
jgi:hypothetical protein